MDEKEIVWFKEISKSDIPLVGGKGANLGEMYNSRFPIPAGFCVTANAYKRFLEESEIGEKIYPVLDKLDVNDTEKLQEVAEQVQDVILNAKMPEGVRKEIIEAYNNLNIDIDVYKLAGKEALSMVKAGRDMPFVAVRSSATAEDLPTASFAGQQKTYLNVKGADNVTIAVQKCWASLFTARAIYYRIKNDFNHKKVFIAVVVQKMVNSTRAGVAFSINPSTNNENEIIIEAGWGLGDAVVAGQVTPDNYIVDKKSLEIKNVKLNDQEFEYVRDNNLGRTVKKSVPPGKKNTQILSVNEIKRLSKLVLNIENHYGKPQDIEWAVEDGRLFIVQARPVTTIKKVEKQETITKEQEAPKQDILKDEILSGLSASPGIGSGSVKIVHDITDISKIQKGNVLVARMTNPDYVAAMERASAIVTDEGGTTCHAAIVSREMGVPCVVGTEKATQVLKEGQEITVDGTKGKVYSGKTDIKEEKEITIGETIENVETITEIKVLMDFPKYAEKAAATGADGVGLLRCEFIILGEKEHPIYLIQQNRKNEFVDNLAKNISIIANAFKGKPVWYRTLDAPTDEFRRLKGGEGEPEEDNPMMGWRSIRRELDQPELLKAEFEAIKKVHDQGLTNVGIMLPLVTDVEQVKKAKVYLKESGLEPQENIDFGVMIETPASVQIIKELCEEGLDFISFGTNDLTQFTLAVDRNNAKVQRLYDEMHPAVLRQIKHVIKVCREYNVETSICGQAGSNPEMAEFLVKEGIDSITANPDAVAKIRRIVSRAEKKLLLSAARSKIDKTG